MARPQRALDEAVRGGFSGVSFRSNHQNTQISDSLTTPNIGGDDGPQTVYVNQREPADDFSEDGVSWETVATVTLDPTGIGTLTVQLTSANTGYVVADAVRVDHLHPPPLAKTTRSAGDPIVLSIEAIESTPAHDIKAAQLPAGMGQVGRALEVGVWESATGDAWTTLPDFGNSPPAPRSSPPASRIADALFARLEERAAPMTGERLENGKLERADDKAGNDEDEPDGWSLLIDPFLQ